MPPSPVLSPPPLTLPTPPSTPLPLSTYFYHDHSSSAGSDSPHSQASSIVVASSPGFSPTGSPVVVVSLAVSPTGSPSRPAHILSSPPSGSSSDSPHGINLYIDFSKFHLQHVPTCVSSTPFQMACTHPMVFRPCPTKNANLSIVAASWITSLPQYEPLSFKDANRYLTWHNAMQEEIQALNCSQT